MDPDRYETRVDIAFPAVSLMHLKPTFESLDIRQVEGSEADRILPPGVSVEGREKVYVFNEGEAYVVAAACEWNVDDGDHHTPSAFGPLRGTE
ncbi:hypothetical protein ACIQCG_31575 [Streptomyces noursei]|uniref:hypothetical protein n=1 Tax=Streptomyces noursei TaxID=1971 RepID=UPI003820E80E